MFKELFAAFKSGETIDQAFSQLSEMLDHCQWMFIRANEVIRRKVAAEDVEEAILRRDKSVNELLRSIRRKIVRHLTINPGTEVAACLALMSVAKDAERIGDYCKNVYEVGRFYTEDFQVEKYHDSLEVIRVQVEKLFEAARTAFNENDSAKAKDVLRAADSIGDACDEIVEQLLQDSASIQTHEAVAYSLLARHYKRVSSHLANVCTAVLGRVEDLDFRP
ncbi:MAG: PhoU family transcriptional regulator [Planctomycetota bacterium]|nr:PhoU family transcriptional regulator [Planctomycetota bacterium]